MLESPRDPPTEAIRRLVNGELAAADAEALVQRLRDDPDARAVYDRVVRVERALAGEPAGLGPLASERVKARLRRSLDANAPAPARWWRRSWAPAALVAATASVGLAVLGPTLWRPDETPDFAARSGTTGAAVSSDFVLQVLKVTIEPEGDVRVQAARRLAGGDDVRFAAFARAQPCWVSLLVVHEDARREVLAARVPLPPASRARRLDVALTVPASWHGEVRFVGIFETEGGAVDLSRVDLRARDAEAVAVRVVRASIGGEERSQ